jgi:Fic family protein
MPNIVKREIKGKDYFYLEQNIRIGKLFKKFSEYLGLEKPKSTNVHAFEKKLDEKIRAFYKKDLIKPKTQFIDLKTAKDLERIKQETNNFIMRLNEKQKKEWIESEREKFITNTNAIEGSTLTLDETKRILRLNEKIGDERERLEVLNMERCLKYYDKLLANKANLDENLILQLHYILLNEIPDYDKYKGVWRPVDIYIKTSKFEFPRHSYVPSLMKKLFDWYEQNKGQLHPVELAAKLHTKFITIHPFADGNGRIARLLMNYILQSNEFPFTNIPTEKRLEYFATQEKGHKEHYKEFTQFLSKQIKENYKELKIYLKKSNFKSTIAKR